MPTVGAEAELRTLNECHYSYPLETQSDLDKVRSLFPDLRLHVDFYCFPNKEKKRLVYLAGTVQVPYEGSQYNIPVCIWLHETHPVSRPRCYVCPSVSMVINPACPCVDAVGNIRLDGLSNWTHGVSNLSKLVSEMRQAFQRDTPLYSQRPLQTPPPADMQMSPGQVRVRSGTPVSTPVRQAPPPAGGSVHRDSLSSSSTTSITSPVTTSITTSSPQSRGLSPTPSHMSGHKAGQWEQSRGVRVGKSYTEDLLGIDFSAAPPPPPPRNHYNPFLTSTSPSASSPDPLSVMIGTLRLSGESSRDHRGGSPVRNIQSHADKRPASAGAAQRHRPDLHPDKHQERRAALLQMASRLLPAQASVFLSLMTMEGRSFSPADVMEAVQLNRDYPSALRFLTHICPICQDQVSFSKIITMTHCSCFLCQTCFTTFFSAAIKERSVEQLVCPQCGQPEVRGQGGLEESMDYFNLLDTQIRHFLPSHIHELFQRKLRDRALQEMPNFCWCAHCSFGMLHESDTLRMDCPCCKKSTCSKCRSRWSPQHQGLSCEQFRVWLQQNQLDHHSSPVLSNGIECPNCHLVFSLSRGGCLHFTCSQCQHQFCGGCSQRFTLGSTCGFSADCANKGLHAHHPRDCLYHLRDWSVSRLQMLLQYFRVSPTWLEPANVGSPDASLAGVCVVLELRDDGSKREEPCGRPAPPECRGYCQLHYKERLVDLINRCRADPAVLFGPAEISAELQRWQVAVPSRRADEPEPLYTHRLRLTLTNSVPLRKHHRSPFKLGDELRPLTSTLSTGAPPPHLLLTE
ncbi:E3 ubiquitin-protein ligase RNF31 [Salarias fasciatus]|uniref:E3 ubiquitin-protein ligase RNF31 n=1 Tax=Salarias fasciatus TaxID=181472 RepID=UPI001176F035|nr:E3 ubiquitin-protein ligase RNF31-like [Salarias fasciatus]